MCTNMDHRLHAESQAFLQILGSRDYSTMTVEAARQQRTRQGNKKPCLTFEGGCKFELFIPSPTKHRHVPVYVYRPSPQLPNPPVLIYFHGGAMITGSRDADDKLCQQLCVLFQCVIVNVEYRHYPEAYLLDPFDDGVWVTQWVQSNVQLIGGGPLSKVGVGGVSSGGRIAASVAHDVTGLAFQLLMYASLAAGPTFPSYEEFRDGPFVTSEMVTWVDKSSDGKSHSNHPRSCALNRSSFTHLPPALFIVAELDPLRDENLAYIKILQDNQVHVEHMTLPGVIHGFYERPETFPVNCKLAFDATAAFIKKFGVVDSDYNANK